MILRFIVLIILLAIINKRKSKFFFLNSFSEFGFNSINFPVMRLFFCSLLFLLQLSFTTKAQDGKYIKNPAIGIHYALFNFNKFSNSPNNSASEKLKQGLAISYLQGISNHFDFSVMLAGSYLDYTLHDGTQLGKGSLLLETDASLIAKMLTDKHLVSPYLTAGLGASKYSSYYGIFFPLGTGLQFNFVNEVYVLLNAQYRFGLTNYVKIGRANV